MDAYIVAGYRTAVGRGKRSVLKTVRPDDMAADVIKHLVSQVDGFDPTRVDDLIVGNAVPEAEQGMQMGRMISLLALPIEVPGVTVNRYCGSGLEAIALASSRIHAGTADCIIAGGTESMSMVPVMGYKTALNYNIATGHSDYYLSMGLTAEQVGKEYGIDREAGDEFAFQSHQKAVKAQAEGKFDDEIVPIKVNEKFIGPDGKMHEKSYTVDKDEGPRADTSKEVLGKLRPVFAQGGQVTAGNSSPVSDGASFVMVMSERMVKELNLEPIARMVTYAAVGVHPRIMGIGPVDAVPKALRQAGLKQNDLDLIELNEAFAAQSLAVIKELDLDTSILNVNGGAIALGHPLGATGCMITGTLLDELERRDLNTGLATLCIGGGMGIATIIERV